MDHNHNFGIVSGDTVLTLVILTSIKGERCTKIRGTSSLGLKIITGVGNTKSTVVGQAVIITGKIAEFLFYGFRRGSSNPKLITKLMMSTLYFLVIAQTSDLVLLMETFGEFYIPWQLYVRSSCI